MEITNEMIDAGCAAWARLYPAFEGEKQRPTAGEVVSLILNASFSVAPSAGDVEMLRSALSEAVKVIKDYLEYTHSGDPWEEDARAMGEMDINEYAKDGRLDYALSLLSQPPKGNG